MKKLMIRHKVNLFNTPIDALSLKETVALARDAIKNRDQLHHIAVNVAKVVHMQTDKQLYDSVVSADIINADGLPLVWVSKLFGDPIPERVTGVDLMQALVELAYKNSYKIFFLGAKEEVILKIVKIYSNQYSIRWLPDIVMATLKLGRRINSSTDCGFGSSYSFCRYHFTEKGKFLISQQRNIKKSELYNGSGGKF